MISCISVIASVLLASSVQADGLVTSIPIKRAPYEILIVQRFDKTQVVGTGAILDNHWVITTATTIIKYTGKPNSLMIRSGSGVYNQGGGLHEVNKIVIHPDFQAASPKLDWGKGDVALLKIFFNFHPSLTVAPIPTPHHVTNENTIAHVVGWPLINGKNTPALKVATTKVVSWEKCRELYSSKTILDEKTLCTQKLSMKAQEGNSLVSSARLIGLYKSSSSFDIESGLDVYIDVASYKIWIDEITAG